MRSAPRRRGASGFNGRAVCDECGAQTKDGAGRAELAPDLLDCADEDEVAVYRPSCWTQEFGRSSPASTEPVEVKALREYLAQAPAALALWIRLREPA